jgi:hypothetical protein
MLAVLPLVPVLGLVVAALLDGPVVKRAFVDLVVRLLGELNLKVVIGLGAAAFASVLWRAVITEAPKEVLRIDFDRHWGGLGSGEGGSAWRIEWPTVRWIVHALALIGFCTLAAVSLFTSPRERSREPEREREAVPVPAPAQTIATTVAPGPPAATLCACPPLQAGAAGAPSPQPVAGSKGRP